jgi:hypothetical protein
MDRLLEMLTYKRPNRSKSEKRYINRFIAPLADPDNFGNYIVKIGDNPKVMFSSHTDTVHKTGGRQKISIDGNTNTVFVAGSECLGADDGTGNWIMLEMIEAGIDGLYVFHRGEECGGLGSRFIAKHNQDLLKPIDVAVAFDRMDFGDVIDSQSSGKCCSPEFADSLAGELGSEWQSCAGLFTDTANYNHLIPECTNISVGYQAQHTKYETQSLDFAKDLLELCLDIDWHALPVKRDVNDFDDGSYYGYGDPKNYYSGGYGSGTAVTDYYQTPAQARWAAMNMFVRNNHDTITDYLIDNSIGVSYLRNYEWHNKIPEIEIFDDNPNADLVGSESDIFEDWICQVCNGYNSENRMTCYNCEFSREDD